MSRRLVSFALLILLTGAHSRSFQRRRSHQGRRRLPLSALSDDFDDQATFDALWTDQDPTNESSASVSGGVLTLTSSAMSTFGWYGSYSGVFLSQPIAAGEDFVVEAMLSVSSASGGLPSGDWHSAGLLVRSAAIGNDDTFAQVNVGRQGPAFGMGMTYGTQAMLTDGGVSSFRYEASSNNILSGRIRICRVGLDVSLLRELDPDAPGVGGMGWHALEYDNAGLGVPSFPFPGLGGDVDVGMMMSRWTDAAENVQAQFEYVRFAEPMSINDCFVDDISTLETTDAPTDSPTTASPTEFPTTDAPTLNPTPLITTASPTVSPTTDATTLNPTLSITTGSPTVSPTTDAPTLNPTPPITTASPIVSPTSSPVQVAVTTNPTDSPTVAPVVATSPPGPAIESFSDEFFDSATLFGWTDIDVTRYTELAIADGVLSVTPSGPSVDNVWFDTFHGAGLLRRVPAGQNFVAETLVNVRVGDNDLPDGDWHVGGLVARSTTQENNWVCANLGLQGPSTRMGIPQSLAVETKTTEDGYSRFNYSPDLRLEAGGPPAGSELTARLRICRVDQEFLLMYMLRGEVGWTVQNPLPSHAPWNGVDGSPTVRADLAGELDVGIMTNHMMNGSGTPMTARFDYVRFGSVGSIAECTGAISLM